MKEVEVYQQNFRGDDYDILYHFVAKDFELKDVMNEGSGYILYSGEKKMIEDKIYKMIILGLDVLEEYIKICF